MNRTKRLISFILSTVLLFSVIVTPASAQESRTYTSNITTYKQAGYTIDYKIKATWDNSQSIDVKITNTGTDSILNWAVQYNAGGTITELSNAVIYKQNDNTYLLKNSGENYEIEPGKSQSFNYTLTGENLSIPSDISLASKEVIKQDGVDIQYKINDDWGNGFQAKITISNNTDAPLEAWKLSFDSNFSILNIWDSKIVSQSDNSYTLGSKSWTNPIPANSVHTISFTGKKEPSVRAEMSDFVLSEVVIAEEIDWEDPTDSDNDGLPDVYESNAFQTNPNKADTDGDNLPDGYEVTVLRTNPLEVDSDNNELSDDVEDFDLDTLTNYQEFLLHTNPYAADTDDDELFDNDEINIHKTDPLISDTDADHIIDCDEIYLGLEPCNPETTDGIPDADAIIHQHIPENELLVNNYNEEFKISIEADVSNNLKRYINQHVSSYSNSLADNKSIVGLPIYINYEAGLVSEGEITFTFDKDFVENNTPYFSDLNSGIDRYGIFYYDEDINTLVPISCEYDNANYTIKFDFSFTGNLIVLDYEALMYNLGIVPTEEEYQAKISTLTSPLQNMPNSVSSNDLPCMNTSISGNDLHSTTEVPSDPETVPENYDAIMSEQINNILGRKNARGITPTLFTSPTPSTNKQIDLVFAIDVSTSMRNTIETCKTKMAQLVTDLYDAGITANIGIITFGDYRQENVIYTLNDSVWAKTAKQASEMISNVTLDEDVTYENHLDAMKTTMEMPYRSNSIKFAVLITDAPVILNDNNCYRENKANTNDIAQALKNMGVTTSVVSKNHTTFKPLYQVTNGIQTSVYGNFHQYLYDFITTSLQKRTYSVITADSLISGCLDEPLIYGGTCDTDGDTLPDSMEIDWKNIDIHPDGSYTLPQWGELCKKSKNYKGGKLNPLFETLSSITVVPAISNPFSADSDNDYYPDNMDNNKLSADAMYINDNALDDTNFHNGNAITEKASGKFTDGKFEVNSANSTAKYTFTRKPGNVYTFTITPKKEGFYLFSGAENINVTYNKGALFWKQKEHIVPESDGTYLLSKDVTYTIETFADNRSVLNFSVQQDNWVFAPNGGVWTITPFNNYFPIERMYISDQMLIDVVTKISDNAVSISNTVSIEAQTESIMKQLEIDDSNKLFVDAILTVISAIHSGFYTAAALLDPEPTTKSILIGLAYDSITTYFLISSTSSAFNYFEAKSFKEACNTGKLNVIFTKQGYITLFDDVWEAWMTNNYINKYSYDSMNRMFVRGTITLNNNVQDVIDYCNF